MEMQNEWIFQILQQYAYQPGLVYAIVIGMMIASGFGLPLPEEVTIVSVGLLTYMGSRPDLFPPPFEGAEPINGYTAAGVTLGSIMFADFLVFMIGRTFGRRLMTIERFRKVFADKAMSRINSFSSRYGEFAVFVFRFTPGIRFPAHLVLGMSSLPAWKFVLIDGIAAVISVPTQILLIYNYGESILKIMQQFKMVILAVIVIALLVWVARKIWDRVKQPQDSGSVKTL